MCSQPGDRHDSTPADRARSCRCRRGLHRIGARNCAGVVGWTLSENSQSIVPVPSGCTGSCSHTGHGRTAAGRQQPLKGGLTMKYPARKLIPGAISIALLATSTFAQTAGDPGPRRSAGWNRFLHFERRERAGPGAGRRPARPSRQHRRDQSRSRHQGNPAVDQRGDAGADATVRRRQHQRCPAPGHRHPGRGRGDQPHPVPLARLRGQEHADRRRRPAQRLGHRHQRDGYLRLREAGSDPRRERPADGRG